MSRRFRARGSRWGIHPADSLRVGCKSKQGSCQQVGIREWSGQGRPGSRQKIPRPPANYPKSEGVSCRGQRTGCEEGCARQLPQRVAEEAADVRNRQSFDGKRLRRLRFRHFPDHGSPCRRAVRQPPRSAHTRLVSAGGRSWPYSSAERRFFLIFSISVVRLSPRSWAARFLFQWVCSRA